MFNELIDFFAQFETFGLPLMITIYDPTGGNRSVKYRSYRLRNSYWFIDWA